MTTLSPVTSRSTSPTVVPRQQGHGARPLAVLGGAFIAVFIALALVRLRYPYELEWMEGGVVDHVGRVLHGHDLYVRPSIHFTPYIYTPLYYYVAALLAKVVGLGYGPLRFISIVGILATFAAIAAWVHTETGDRWASVAGAGLFAACFRVGGGWFDLAREDSLMLGLLMCGLVVARRATSAWRFALAGALLGLAVLTKQSAAVPAIAVLPWAWRAGRRSFVAFAASLAVVAGVPAAVLELASHGWFSTYVVYLPGHHDLVPRVLLTFWTQDLLRPLPLAVLAGVAVVAHRWRTPATRWFVVPVIAGLTLTAFSSRLHSGGYDNVLLPAYAAIAVLFGIAAADVVLTRWRTAALWLLAAQLALLAYNPFGQLPSASAERGGDQLLVELRSLHGSVYLPGHGWYLDRTGHVAMAQGAAIEDVLRVPGAPGRTELISELRTAIVEERFDYVVVDSGSGYSYLPSVFRNHYRPAMKIQPLAKPVTGTITAPAVVWERM